MPPGNVSRLASAFEKNASSRNTADPANSMHSRSTRDKKTRNEESSSKIVMSMPDRVQRPRRCTTSQPSKLPTRKSIDLAFLNKKPRHKESSETVTTSQTTTTAGTRINSKPQSNNQLRQTDADYSDDNSSFESFESLDFPNFDDGSFESGVFMDDNDSNSASIASVEMCVVKGQRIPGQKCSYSSFAPHEEKDITKIRRQHSDSENLKRSKKESKVRLTSRDIKAVPKRRVDNKESQSTHTATSVEMETGNVRMHIGESNRKPLPKSKVIAAGHHYENESIERKLKKKVHQTGSNDDADRGIPGKQRLRSKSNVQNLALSMGSNHSSRSEMLTVKGSCDGGDHTISLSDNDRSSRKSRVNANDRKSDHRKIGKQSITENDIDFGHGRTTAMDQNRHGEKSGASIERHKMPTRLKKQINVKNNTMNPSGSSGQESIIHSLTKDESSTRTRDSSRMRERSISRERSRGKSLNVKKDSQILQAESTSSTQPMSLLDSASDFNFSLEKSDEDIGLQLTTRASRISQANCQTYQLRMSSQHSQGIVQTTEKKESGKHKPYRSKFRDQYGAMGVVETASLAPVKTAKSIFEKNQGENDLMRISKKRSPEKKAGKKARPLRLPVHHNHQQNMNQDDFSVSLASLVGNIVLSDSSQSCSRIRLDEKSLSSFCSGQSLHKDAQPTRFNYCQQSLSKTHEGNPGSRKIKNEKSLEFLEKLSLKKAREDGPSRIFRGSRVIRRTKRIENDNTDWESCCETENEGV